MRPCAPPVPTSVRSPLTSRPAFIPPPRLPIFAAEVAAMRGETTAHGIVSKCRRSNAERRRSWRQWPRVGHEVRFAVRHTGVVSSACGSGLPISFGVTAPDCLLRRPFRVRGSLSQSSIGSALSEVSESRSHLGGCPRRTALACSIHEQEFARRQGIVAVCASRGPRSCGLGEMDMAQALVACGGLPVSPTWGRLLAAKMPYRACAGLEHHGPRPSTSPEGVQDLAIKAAVSAAGPAWTIAV